MGIPSKQQSPSVKVTSLSDQVYEYLRHGIICADFTPGEKLIELDIAARMGTSQGPVREALQRLEHDGLVERRARSATFVTNIALDEMFELFSIRNVIEGFAIRRAAQKITSAQCTQLSECIQKMAEEGRRHEIIGLAEYDMQFHRHIVEWSGSPGLLRAWTPLSSQIQRFIVQSHPEQYPDFVEVGVRHQPILEALRKQDVEASVAAVQENIMLIWSKINP